MKKEYQIPSVQVVSMTQTDVISTSLVGEPELDWDEEDESLGNG